MYISNSNGPKTCKQQGKIIRAFEFLAFRIEISPNFKMINFLDVTFALNNNSFKHFNKKIKYITISMSIQTKLDL